MFIILDMQLSLVFIDTVQSIAYLVALDNQNHQNPSSGNYEYLYQILCYLIQFMSRYIRLDCGGLTDKPALPSIEPRCWLKIT